MDSSYYLGPPIIKRRPPHNNWWPRVINWVPPIIVSENISLMSPESHRTRSWSINTPAFTPSCQAVAGHHGLIKGGGYYTNFHRYVIFLFFFQLSKQRSYITFIFDRSLHSLAAGTLVKYECDSKKIRCIFAKLEIFPTDNLRKGD